MGIPSWYQQEFLEYSVVLWDIIFKGFLFTPWYAVKFFFSGCQTKYLCVPWKKHCSVNGKNRKVKFCIPFGILEALAVYLLANAKYVAEDSSAHYWPIVYANIEQLLTPGNKSSPGCNDPDNFNWMCMDQPVRSHLLFPPFLGSWRDARVRRDWGDHTIQSSLFTALDGHGLWEMRENCKKNRAKAGINTWYGWDIDNKAFDGEVFKSIYAKGMMKSWVDDFDGPGGPGTLRTVDDAIEDQCNFLSISLKCICAGHLALSWKDSYMCDFSMKPTSWGFIDDNNNRIDNYQGMQCRQMHHLSDYWDLKDMEIAWRPRRYIWLMFALVVTGSRLGAYWADMLGRFVNVDICQGELRKPGAQWINGWWAAVLTYMAMQEYVKLRDFVGMRTLHDDQKSADPQSYYSKLRYANYWVKYFKDDSNIFGYRKDMKHGHLYGYDHLNLVLANTAIKNLWLAIWANIACSFISEQAYCNDCTSYAYTMENIERVRRRDKRVAQLQTRKSLKTSRAMMLQL